MRGLTSSLPNQLILNMCHEIAGQVGLLLFCLVVLFLKHNH